MKSNISIYHNILKKYKMVQPIDIEIQSYIISSRKSNLKSTLKKLGNFSFLYYWAFTINIFLRKFGIRVSMLQSKIILCIVISLVSVSGASASYYTSKYIYKRLFESDIRKYENKDTNKSISIQNKETLDNTRVEKPIDNNTIITAKYYFALQPFASDEMSKKFQNKIIKSIKKKYGNNCIVILKNNYKRNFDIMIRGSLKKVGSAYVGSVTFIDNKNSKHLLIFKKDIVNSKDIDIECNKIITKLSNRLQF